MPTPSIRSRVTTVTVTVLLVAAGLVGVFRYAPVAVAVSDTIVISQVYGGGGNSGATYKNDFIELYNRGTTAVSVTGWSVQYASNTGSTWQVTPLTGVIQPGEYYLVQEAAGSGGTVNLPTPNATGSIAMSGTAGKVALVSSTTALAGTCPVGSTVDFVGYGPTTNCSETTPTPNLSNTTAAHRRFEGTAIDTDNNAGDFVLAPPYPRNAPPPSLVLTGATARPSTLAAGWQTLLSVTVSPNRAGTSVVADLTAIGLPADQAFLDDGVSGDGAAGDGVYSYVATVGASVSVGAKHLPVTARFNLEQASATVTVTVISAPPMQTIADIQGVGSTSPFANETVTTTGIVTGVKSNGYFVQMPGEGDGMPGTSDGIFVYTGATRPAEAVVGNEVAVIGTVTEYVADPPSSLTEISYLAGASISIGNELPLPASMTAEASAFTDLDWLERYEGMRVHASSLTVVAPTGGSKNEPNAQSTSNGAFYAVLTGVDRPFREPGIAFFATLPPGSPATVTRFDTNPERLRVDSDALGGASLEVASGQLISNMIGVLDYSYGSYTILPDASGGYGVLPPVSSGGVRAAMAGEVTVASFNMERFYDAVDDPGTGDVRLSLTGYDRRLTKASIAIRQWLNNPDVIGVEEVENLATLNAIAARVESSGGPHYLAYLLPGNDPGGINVGLLVKESRFGSTSVEQVGKDATFVDPTDASTDLLNDRPPLMLRAEAKGEGGRTFPMVVIVNHLRSLIDVDTEARVREKRKQQAIFLANTVRDLGAGTRVALVGDFNAFEFSDGYVDVMGILRGLKVPDDEVVLASPSPIPTGLVDLLGMLPAGERYSYVEQGNAQVLDHILVSASLRRALTGFAYARFNADYPESLRGDGTRAERLSDHDAPVAFFNLQPEAELALSQRMDSTVISGGSLASQVTLTNNGPDAADHPIVRFASTHEMTPIVDAVPAGWVCEAGASELACSAGSLAAAGSVTFDVTYEVACSVPDATPRTVRASASSSTADPVAGNNSASASVTISNPAPVIRSLSLDKSILWPPNHQWVDVLVTYDVTDNCGRPANALTVASSEAVNAKGDGSTSVDWQVVDDRRVRLRAERSGVDGPRVYTITLTSTDDAGGASRQTVTVTVPKSMGK